MHTYTQCMSGEEVFINTLALRNLRDFTFSEETLSLNTRAEILLIEVRILKCHVYFVVLFLIPLILVVNLHLTSLEYP